MKLSFEEMLILENIKNSEDLIKIEKIIEDSSFSAKEILLALQEGAISRMIGGGLVGAGVGAGIGSVLGPIGVGLLAPLGFIVGSVSGAISGAKDEIRKNFIKKVLETTPSPQIKTIMKNEQKSKKLIESLKNYLGRIRTPKNSFIIDIHLNNIEQVITSYRVDNSKYNSQTKLYAEQYFTLLYNSEKHNDKQLFPF